MIGKPQIINEIIKIVYSEFGLDYDTSLSKKRYREIVTTKNVAILFIKEITDLSFEEISNMTPIINRKQTANRHGYNTLINDLSTDKELSRKVGAIGDLISMSTLIPNNHNSKYIKKKRRKVNFAKSIYKTTMLHPQRNLVVMRLNKFDNSSYICIDSEGDKSMIGKQIIVGNAKEINKISYPLKKSPLYDTYLFELFVKSNNI